MTTNKITSMDQEPIQLSRLSETLDAAGIHYVIHVHSLAVHSAQDGVEQGFGVSKEFALATAEQLESVDLSTFVARLVP